MADTGILDVDKDFVWTRLLYGDLLVVDRSAGFLDDLNSFSADTPNSQQ